MTIITSRLNWLRLAALSALLWVAACQDPTTLGTDLLEEDHADVGFTDTLHVRSTTIPGDSVLTFTRLGRFISHLFGDLRDPVFGRSEASIYAQVRLERTGANFENSKLDSIVLVLPYDTLGEYGDVRSSFGVDVFRVTSDMDFFSSYYSTTGFETQGQPIGSGIFTPSRDSLPVIEYLTSSSRDTIKFPHARIPLDERIGAELLSLDTSILKSDSAFLNYFKGIYIRPSKESRGITSFDLSASPYRGGIYLYYTQNDTTKRQFQFAIDDLSPVVPHYEHTYTGATITPYINNTQAGNDIVFVQGMTGVNVEIQLPDLEPFKGLIVNKAELVLNLRRLDNDDSSLTPAPQFQLSVRDTSGALTPISDVSLARQAGVFPAAFGGQYDSKTDTYKMNISSYMQQAINGKQPDKLILTVFPKSQRASRSILYGAGDPDKGIKIRLAFTRL